ncbi:MAG TPA: BrnA antitoxin family protein [Bdellovibrionota bacterium]|nr:BrnA antitoxin family protein [Bdellovibrionota bacterium]
MKHTEEFPFERARRVSSAEVRAARKAIEEKLGIKRKNRGRPPKGKSEKYRAVSIRLHPKVLAWVRREAKRHGLGYQSLINEILLQLAA